MCIIYIHVQADLRDTVGLVPDHHNRANFTIKRVTQTFWFPSANQSCAYTVLWSAKCVIAWCIKKSTYLN